MANLKNTTIDIHLELPKGNTSQRPSSSEAAMIRYNTDSESVEFYNDLEGKWFSVSDTGVDAEGGITSDIDINGKTYRVHYFTSLGTNSFTVNKGGEVEYLIVAGGGSGGGENGGSGVGGTRGAGGGGAGGIITGYIQTTPQTYSINIGTGGQGDNFIRGRESGTDSSAFGLTAVGGGGGGTWDTAPLSGGSGGGGGIQGSAQQGANGILDQGNQGGNGVNPNDNAGGAGGGGGAGSAGTNGSTDYIGGNGGEGLVSVITGSNRFYAAGGGAGAGGLGGVGGGGNNRGNIGVPGKGENALPFTGSGGGGAASITNSANSLSGSGSNGLVIIRYPKSNAVSNAPNRHSISSLPGFYQPITKNLVYYLDPTDPLCYSGSGSIINDLSHGNWDSTFDSGAIFNDTNGGSFEFTGSSGSSVEADNFFIGNDPLLTIAMWIKPKESISSQGFWGIGGTNSSGGINGYSNPGRPNKIGWDLWGSTSYDNNVDYVPYEWMHIVWVKNSTGFTLNGLTTYLNGVEYPLTNIARESSNSVNLQTGLCLGGISVRSGSYHSAGEIGHVHVYDRALTEYEIKHIFNTTRWRYGV